MPPRKRSIFKEPTVVSTIITVVVGGIITGVFSLILKAMDAPVNTAPNVTNTLLPANKIYAAQLLFETQKWPLVAKDNFDSNKFGWFEGDSSTSKTNYTISIVDGIYSWKVKAKNTGGTVVWPKPTKIDITPNFYVAVDVQNMSQLDTAGYGLTFRNQGASNHYGFIIYSTQKIVVRYDRNENGQTKDTSLANLTSEEILPYTSNRIAVIGIGNEFWFYINDIFVNYIKHEGPLTGSFGLAVAAANKDDEILVKFDNFELREAP